MQEPTLNSKEIMPITQVAPAEVKEYEAVKMLVLNSGQ